MFRTLVAATLLTSVLVHTELIAFYYVAYVQPLILQMPPKWPQIWRVVTPFLITGPKFGILMDPYFCMSTLELDGDQEAD
jgi:Derlin-2/3